jgi:hypothetical protein
MGRLAQFLRRDKLSQIFCPDLARHWYANRGYMHDLIVLLFTIAAGMTASGILASLYRMVATEPQTWVGTCLHYVVMVIAGPVVLISNSTKSFREKQCSKPAYALAMALGAYWSFVTGVLIVSLAVIIRGT